MSFLQSLPELIRIIIVVAAYLLAAGFTVGVGCLLPIFFDRDRKAFGWVLGAAALIFALSLQQGEYALAIIFVLLLMLGYMLRVLFVENRLLYFSLSGVSVIFLVASTGYAIYYFLTLPKEEKRIQIAIRHEDAPKIEPVKPKEKPKKEVKIEKPKPKPPPKVPDILALPKGKQDGDKNAKVMPKGTRLDTDKSGKPGQLNKKPGAKPPGPIKKPNLVDKAKVLTSKADSDFVMPDNPESDGKGSPFGNVDNDGLNRNDIPAGGFGKGKDDGDDGGDNGDDYGDPDGKDHGAIPRGFPNGKVGGKLYFIRLKHGDGAWEAWQDGLKKLMRFMSNNAMVTHNDTWPMSAKEIHDKYISKGGIPTFIYVYVDDTFKLAPSEITILQNYVSKGGFLFLDSRPDPYQLAMGKVKATMRSLIPGGRWEEIRRADSINTFLFRLPSPGYGENYVEKRNYGIRLNGKLVAFFSEGNYVHLFNSPPANMPQDYITGNYQMACNIIYYAITKGNPSGVPRKAGADTRITTALLEKSGLLGPKPGVSKPAGDKPGPVESVKIKRTPKPKATLKPGQKPTPDEPEPDEIKVLDE